MNFILNAYAIQDIGHRTNQEDCFYPPFIDPCHYDESPREWTFYDGTPHMDDRLFIVCDGMGGHDRGEIASQTVTQAMSTYLLKSASIEGVFPDEMVNQAVDKALLALAEQDDPDEVMKMGTTMTMLKFHANGATVAHIGDSRVYHFRPARPSEPAKMLFCTEDHTVVNELVHYGQITHAQARRSTKKHILSRAMLSYQERRPKADIHHISDIQPGDIFFLCTDGIFENMDNEALCSLLTDPNYSDVQRIQMILHECINNRDNHTAIFVRVQDILNTSDRKSSDASLAPGTVLKSENYTYHIEKVLGSGAFGITYLVNTNVSMQGQLGTIHTGVKVALKEFFMHKEMKREGVELVPISENSDVKQYANKFRREASKLAMLSHPNIVKVLEVFEANNTIYYSMEYLPDGTLDDYVDKRGGLPEKEAIGCIRQIASALMYLHTNKLLHLDIKPANIMRIESTNTLKIIDFGLAKRYEKNGDPESSANLGFGTTGYAPLEQADANMEHEFSPELDVYALGATYYKLLTNHVPNTAIDVLNRGLNTMPLVKKDVSQKSIDAIKAAMEPTKAKRLKTVEAFLDMLPRIDDETIFKQEEDHKFQLWMVIILSIVVLGSTFGVIFMHDSDRDDKAPITITPTVKQFDMPMVEIKGGSFTMGSDLNTDPDAEEDEAPRHQVTVSSFKMGKYLVTQSEWKQVMEDTKAQKSKNGKYPMINVTWEEVQTFISRLNEQTGRHFRLPTEAEWEYAARGGAKASNKGSIYSGGDDLKTMGWYADNSGNRPHPVGMLAPNALGLYDMSGNVWEYCSDWYGDYQAKKQTNPKGPATGDYHVIRGGSWNSSSHCCRITYRQDNSIISPAPDIGFRLVEE